MSPQPQHLLCHLCEWTFSSLFELFAFFISFSFFYNWKHPSRSPWNLRAKLQIQEPWRPTPQTKAWSDRLFKTLHLVGQPGGICSVLCFSFLCMTEKTEYSHISHRGKWGRTFLLNMWDFNKGNNMNFLVYFSKQTSKTRVSPHFLLIKGNLNKLLNILYSGFLNLSSLLHWSRTRGWGR